MCQNATMRCMEYGLKHNTIYVKKTSLVMCYNPPLVGDKPLRTAASVKLVYSNELKCSMCSSVLE